MKCNEIKEKFMDLIYDEISPEDKRKVQYHIRRCKACKKEFMELKNTSAVLQKWEIPEPNMNLVFVQEKSSLLDRIKESLKILDLDFRKFGIAFGGAAIGLFLILSLFNFEVTKTSEGFSVKMGVLGKDKPAVDDKVLLQEMTKVQRETIALFTRILEEREETQDRDYQATFAELARTLENRRNVQFTQLESALIESHNTNSKKIDITNETLNRFISTAGLKLEK